MKKIFIAMLLISFIISATTITLDKLKDNTMKINVQTSADIEVYIDYGLESGNYSQKTKVYKNKDGKELKINLENLELGKKYFFRVATKEKSKDSYTFEKEESFTAIEEKNKKENDKNGPKETKEISIKPSGDIYGKPVLSSPTKDSISINIFFSDATEYYYQYGLDKTNLDTKTEAKVAEKEKKNSDVLKNLKENSSYYYRVYTKKEGQNDFSPSEIYSFHTAKSGNFSFLIEADPHFDENSSGIVYEKTLSSMLKENPDFLIDMGDVTMVEKLTKMSDKELYDRNSLVRTYWDNIAHSVPIFMVMGNHDGESAWSPRTTKAKEFRNLLLPSVELNAFYKGLKDTIYSFNWGDALFVVLDPFSGSKNRPQDNWDWTLGKEQYSFLENTLKNDKSKFKFVFIHNLVGGNGENERGGATAGSLYEWGGNSEKGIYEFPNKRPELNLPIHQLLKKYGVDIVFHGHDHFYAKEELDGIIYQLVPQPSLGNKQNVSGSQEEYGYKNGEFLPSSGFLKVTLEGKNANVSYISSEGETITNYSINKK